MMSPTEDTTMRRYVEDKRRCQSCGRVTGMLHVTDARVFDFGADGPGISPIEPDMTEPRRCDDCELLARDADPAYVALCGKAPEWMLQQVIARGGVPPKPKSD